MRLRLVIPLVILAVFFLAALTEIECGIEDKEAPAYGDAIVVASIADARTLIPILASDSASGDICGMIFNGLVKYDKNLDIAPDLAESWEILDDGLAIVFHLRKNVKWHDGAPFTAKDVEFTYNRLIDPAVKTPYSGDFERVRTFEVLDDYTVRISYKEPFSPALPSWGIGMMPAHLLANEDLNKTRFSRRPVGTGPYKFKSWKTANLIELVSNGGYFEGRPYIDRYIYRIIPDSDTIFLELKTHGVDLTSLTPFEFTKKTDDAFFAKNYRKFRYPSFSYTYMGYNLSDRRFSDVRVRKAIDYAVDKDEVLKAVLYGLGKVTTGPFMMDSWAYNTDVKPLARDIAKAKGLLAEAGWRDADGDGYLEKDGGVFEFTVLVNQGNTERLKVAELVQSYLKDVGIAMKIRVVEWNAMINEFVNKRRFEAVLLGWSLSRDPDNYDIWHSSKVREGEFNFIGYANLEVDRLLEEGRRTFDNAKRAEIYHRVHKIIYEDHPCLFLYSADVLPIASRRFRGIEVSPIGIGHNFIKWYVPKGEQRYK